MPIFYLDWRSKYVQQIITREGIFELEVKGTRQKGLQNILRSDVDIVLASVYCYCLRAEQSDHHQPPLKQRSVVNRGGLL